MRYLLASLFLLVGSPLFSQQKASVVGFFLSDSTKVGEPIGYSLSVKYPRNYQVYFPDTLFDYQPFEIINKQYYSTIHKNGFYVDSAVFYLRTFEMDNRFVFSLPVYLFNGRDTVAIFSNLDTLYFKSILPDTLKKAQLMADTSMIPIPRKTNFVLYFIAIIAIVITLAAIWFFFGNKIRSLFKKYNINRSHKLFLKSYHTYKNSLLLEDNTESWNQLLKLWKKHVGLLLGKSIDSLTTREICIELNNQSLKKHLQQIDNRVYGNLKIDVETNTQYLLTVAEELFVEKTTENN